MPKKGGRTGGPHIKNGHLIGKGGGQVKPVDGSFVKGIAKTNAPKTPKPNVVQKSVIPAKKAPPTGPGKSRTLSSAPKPPAKKTTAKPLPKVMAAKVVAAKKAMPTKSVTPSKVKVKKGPTKGR